MNDCPCNGCTDRYVGTKVSCHAICERYIKWKKQKDVERRKQQLECLTTHSARTGYWMKRDGYWKNSKIHRRRK